MESPNQEGVGLGAPAQLSPVSCIHSPAPPMLMTSPGPPHQTICGGLRKSSSAPVKGHGQEVRQREGGWEEVGGR